MGAPWDTVPPPTVAGGTGGSGTRIVTEVLSSAGFFMGSRLNRSGDARYLIDFDWRWGKPYLRGEMTGEPAPLEQMRDELESSLRGHLEGYDPGAGPWGWKHPHSYLLLPWLDSVIPGLRFVHMIRDGRQMVSSSNQRQPLHYGDVVLGPAAGPWSRQVRAVEFWCWANERAADYGEQHMDGRYLRIRFEDICGDPHRECARLIEFARDGAAPSAELVARAAQLVSPPSSQARTRSGSSFKRAARRLEHRLRRRQLEAIAAGSLKRFGYL
jgi:Sulfotransferase family